MTTRGSGDKIDVPPGTDALAEPKSTRRAAKSTGTSTGDAAPEKPAMKAPAKSAKADTTNVIAGEAPTPTAAKSPPAKAAAKTPAATPKTSRAKAKPTEPESVQASSVSTDQMPTASTDTEPIAQSPVSPTSDSSIPSDASDSTTEPSPATTASSETASPETLPADITSPADQPLSAAREMAPATPEPGVPLGKRGRPRTKLEDLTPGSEFEGKVLSVAAFGFFVDIGAMTDGLVHVSELGQRRMKIGDVVKVGEVVRVRVKEVDLAKGRVALTMRPQVPNPMSGMRVGDVLTGKITTITKYGAFVDIDSETEGLVHISELSSGYVAKIEDVVRPGEQVEVRIKEVDPSRNRISLTMVGLTADQARESERQTDRDGREGERSGRRGDDDSRREAEEETPYEEPERVPTVVEIALMRALGQLEGEEGEGSRQNKSGKRKKSGMYDVYTRMLEEYRSEKKS